ncbi:MAG: chloride channel protein [Clostridia bacterium]|nr:chloride channel protein [Clostridia bacterium]
MKGNRSNYIKKLILPCLGLSAVAGIVTGAVIFLFKIAANAVIELSDELYALVRANPAYLPLLCIGAALIGLFAAVILRWEPSCRGGGIPTSIAILRGLITFRWLRSLIATFISAIMTYFGGIPLGTEGPSVQMGTLLGRGTVRTLAKNNLAWDRYIMTGGACAGFACATGAPLTGILFAFEEAHRRFSPMIFMTAATAVFSGYAISKHLCELADIAPGLFDLSNHVFEMPLRYLWVPLAVGIIAGLIGAALAWLYRSLKAGIERIRLSIFFKIPVIFALTALIGFASSKLIGTGHSLIDLLLEEHGIWYLSILILAVRAILLIVSTNAGITGGLFIPSLAFGALIGSIAAEILIKLGLLPSAHYLLIVTVGMASFLAAFSRTPLMAIAFSFELLGGTANLLPIILSVSFAYTTIETVGIPSFVETIIEGKEETQNRGKKATVVNARITVMPRAFAVGKEIRDILWPPTCTVLSVTKNPEFTDRNDGALHPGDILHVHYRTFDPTESKALFESIVGVQPQAPDARTHAAGENYEVPQL